LPAPIVNGGEDRLGKVQFSELPMILTLVRVIRHIVVHQSSASIYIPNFTEIGKTFYGRMYRWTYLRTLFRALTLLGRLRGVDLIFHLHFSPAERGNVSELAESRF